MELKRMITHFTYRIEPKPEGGFVAHANDPTVPQLEAATREELQQKIQATIAAGLAAEFPNLRAVLENKEHKFAFHVERKSGGGFTIRSADPNAPPINIATGEGIESHFAEKFLTFVGKRFAPEMAQALAAQGKSGDVKVFVDRKTGITVNAGSNTLRLGVAANPVQPEDASVEDAKLLDVKTINGNLGSSGSAISNSPITPEASSRWATFGFLLALLAIAALIYFFFHSR